jgi:hypothetical protein
MSNRDPWVTGGPTGDELERVNRGIDETMRALVREERGRPKGPVSIIPTPAVAVAPAVAREVPLGPRPAYEVGLIDALAAKFVGGPNEPVK